MDPEIHTEVPETLKRLIRYIVRGFYSMEHALIIDLLVRHPCMKEDDILELLKFERKQLRALIVTLKNDKFLKTRMRVETDAEGKTTRHNFYFINYSTFVNVVKYKLDVMYRKIEMEERDSTSRASFKCPSCQKMFTDLEADQLFDPMQGTFICTFCNEEVEEEATQMPKKDARTLMVKFNEQMSPIYALLKEVEDVKLAHNLVEPEPVDLKDISGHKEKSKGSSSAPGSKWSGDATRNMGFGATENRVTVSMEGEGDASVVEKLPVKETPVWMSQSTVEGNITEPFGLADSAASASVAAESKPDRQSDDIMRTLLAHEKKGSAPVLPSAAPPRSDDDTSTSESEDEVKVKPPPPPSAFGGVEEMESDEDDDGDPMVTIGMAKVPYNEVTEEMVERMTPIEKDEYIRIGQEMYENMYD